MRRAEPDEEALFFPKCPTMKGIAKPKPWTDNIIFLDDKTILDEKSLMPIYAGKIV